MSLAMEKNDKVSRTTLVSLHLLSNGVMPPQTSNRSPGSRYCRTELTYLPTQSRQVHSCQSDESCPMDPVRVVDKVRCIVLQLARLSASIHHPYLHRNDLQNRVFLSIYMPSRNTVSERKHASHRRPNQPEQPRPSPRPAITPLASRTSKHTGKSHTDEAFRPTRESHITELCDHLES